LYRIGADISLIGPGVVSDQDSGLMLPVGDVESKDAVPDQAMILPMSEYLGFQGVDAATRVGRYSAHANLGGREIPGVFMGVDRADFTRVAFWRGDFASFHPGELMNLLARGPGAVLIPHDFAMKNGLHEGDYVRLNVILPDAKVELITQVVGFFEYFPTWYPQEEGPLFVGNLDDLFTQAGGVFPYEVWLYTQNQPNIMALKDGLTERRLYTWQLREPYTYIANEQSRPERQGMFGLLSAGYSAAALLTVLGFFMYSLFSFRRRLVEMGILRAVGMSTRQMGALIAFELAFLILTGLTLGTGLGIGINRLFIPYLQIGNGAAAVTPPFLIEMAWPAVFQIYILFALLFVIALLVLIALLRRMRIFEAIKLGETV
jgi:putative ABC transport system permease protein